MATWKPISEYPTNVLGVGPLVLARDAEKHYYLAVLSKGHFYICPGVPLFYGEHQLAFTTCDHIIEYTDLPE